MATNECVLQENVELQHQLESSEREKQTVRQQMVSRNQVRDFISVLYPKEGLNVLQELQQQLESSEIEKQTVRQQMVSRLISSQRRVSQVCVELMQCNEVLLTAGD